MSDNVAHALSGAGGGVIAMAVTYPLLAISSRLQVQKDNTEGQAYKNTIDAFIKVVKAEGLTGLYSGLGSGMFAMAVNNGVYYYCYEAFKAVLEKAKKKPAPMTIPEAMAAGAVAGITVAIVTHPIWTVNTRMTVARSLKDKTMSAEADKSALAVALSILKKEGLSGWYSGLQAALALVLNPIIQFTLFEQIKKKLLIQRKLTSVDFFVLGALTKMFSTAITYPYLVIRSRMQVRTQKDEQYTSLSDAFRKIIAAEGVKGLYKGISSKLVQSALTAAFLFMAKEALFGWTVKALVATGARRPAKH
ncbi:mitochondrial carrier domain-containing protein [Radiomyces spectabilis]|uniref:mitochondrial carrier domain-containing protein n=1 Tax=Radiomyces spectabilis TaxID=64574 RepID=UPI0022200C1D|nr:mitochondrial carrier domain-containing protein [Radiomyces spectabilis]KAI8391580.1 mitochondrial carrier domain-containing protein [Radiomyces spectabilis]